MFAAAWTLRAVTGDSGDDGQVAAGRSAGGSSPAGAAGSTRSVPSAKFSGALLVVAGFGSTCCHSANALRAAEPHMLVRQFSYLGLTAAGQPIPYGRAGDLPIQVLGDRMAAQVDKLYQQAGTPVDIVAESEGTLGVYAMLARHPHVPIGSVVLLSPIVEPGQLGQGVDTVPAAALTTLNDLVGGMSPYGRSGAQALIESVSEVGASYFTTVSRETGRPWLAVIPLAERGHAARLPLAAERDLHRRLPRRPARRPLGAAASRGVPCQRHRLGQSPGRPGGRVPAGPAQRGSAHRGRSRRLADAGPALRLPFALAGWREWPAIRYAMPVMPAARLQWWRRP